jgi:hypothetical protein
MCKYPLNLAKFGSMQGCQIFFGAAGKNIPNGHKVQQMTTIHIYQTAEE